MTQEFAQLFAAQQRRFANYYLAQVAWTLAAKGVIHEWLISDAVSVLREANKVTPEVLS